MLVVMLVVMLVMVMFQKYLYNLFCGSITIFCGKYIHLNRLSVSPSGSYLKVGGFNRMKQEVCNAWFLTLNDFHTTCGLAINESISLSQFASQFKHESQYHVQQYAVRCNVNQEITGPTQKSTHVDVGPRAHSKRQLEDHSPAT